ncbi:DUF4381 domain-containing protein [Halomonas huangheensis]|nr:DUF4381 domain-containing protein [Halomonas huangheensis]
MSAETSSPPRPLMLPEMIEQLSPPPVPAQISWLPQTWGWALIGGILLVLVVWWAWRQWRRWQANAYRRQALAELEHRLASGEGATALAEIVRRTALAVYPRQHVANLRGTEWTDFLDRTLPSKRRDFAGPLGELLSTGPYRPVGSVDQSDLKALSQLVRSWIRDHRTNLQQETSR